MPTFNVFLDKRNSRKDGTYPIKIRITHNRQSKEVSTGYYIPLDHYNSKTRKVNRRNSNYKQINLLVQQQILKYQENALNLELEGKPILEGLFKERKEDVRITIIEFIDKTIEDLIKTHHYGNAAVYKDLKSSFQSYIERDIEIKQLNYNVILKYESYLKSKGLKTNSIAVYLRTLRALTNKAIKLGYLEREKYPFKEFSIKHERTRKRALQENEIKKIEEQALNYPLCSPKSFALRIFLIAFRTRGMSFTDLAHLKKSDVSNGRILYRRQKTHQLYDVLITPGVNDLLKTFDNKNTNRLLPLLNEKSEKDKAYRKMYLQSVLKRINKHLKEVGRTLCLSQVLTTYVARHSFASIARRKGYSIELIAQAMGHSYGNSTTQIYLEEFDQEVIDRMHLDVCI